MDSWEPSRLHRLLANVENDAGNLALRTDAIREACDSGHWDIAGGLIEAGLQAHPDDAGLLAHSGFACLQAQRYRDAEEALSSALTKGLDTPKLRYNLAFAQVMQERHADALERLAAPHLCEAVPLVHLLRARCLQHLGRATEAIVDCRALVAIAPADAEAHGVLSLLLQEQGEKEAARRHVEIALRLDASQPEAMLAAASLQWDARDYDGARLAFEMLVHAHPECGRGWLGLGLLAMHHRELEMAERYLELAAAHVPQHVGTWQVMGWIQVMRDNVRAARSAFHRALAPHHCSHQPPAHPCESGLGEVHQPLSNAGR